MPVEFTFSFWVIKVSDSSSNINSRSYDIMNAFGRLYFTANTTGTSGTHQIKLKVILDNDGSSVSIPSSTELSLPFDKWTKISISLESLS